MNIEIKPENLLDTFKSLSQDNVIIVDSGEEISARIQLLNIQLTAMENLFVAYINKSSDQANELHLNEFLDKYKALYEEAFNEKKNALINALGFECYVYISNNNFSWNFDVDIHKIIITKTNNIRKPGCQQCK